MKKRRRHADPAAGFLCSAGRGKEKPHPKGDPGEPDELDSWSPSRRTNHCKSQIMLQVLVGQQTCPEEQFSSGENLNLLLPRA